MGVGSIKQGLTRLLKGTDGQLSLKRVLIVSAISISLVALAGFFIITFLKTDINRDAELLQGISINNENYEDMTEEQRDAQLKRQIGHTVTDLKKKELTEKVLKNHKNAVRAGKALRVAKDSEKSSMAYAIAAKTAGSDVNYQFFYEYSVLAASYKKYDVALDQLNEAKKRINTDASLSEETKKSILSDLKWRTEYIKALSQNA